MQKGYSSSSRLPITLKVDKGTVPLSLPLSLRATPPEKGTVPSAGLEERAGDDKGDGDEERCVVGGDERVALVAALACA